MPHRLAPALLGLLVLLAVPAADPAVSGAAAPATATDWRWPVDPPHPVVRQYLAPATPYGAGHRGIDIGSAGSEVFAPADGVVSFAGVVVGRPVLAIRHPGGLVSSYEPVESMLKPGDAVSRGQPIGTLLGGHCASLCLHFGVRLDGQYVSPLNYLGEIPRSVLLPTRQS